MPPSKLFQKAFKGTEGDVYLPDDNADSMEYPIDFLYRRVVPDCNNIAILRFNCLKLYYLVEKLCVSDLNKLLDGFQAHHKNRNYHWRLEIS